MISKCNAMVALVLVLGLSGIFSFGAQAASVGYGSFEGEFEGSVNSGSDINTTLGDSVEYRQIAKWEGSSSGDVEFTMTEFKNSGGEPIGGFWEYLADTSISMLLSVKYDGLFSIFRYDQVNPGDDGLFASDPALTGQNMSTNKNGQPFAISHVRAWSFDSQPPTVIPLPPALMLFASALAGLLGVARIRGA